MIDPRLDRPVTGFICQRRNQVEGSGQPRDLYSRLGQRRRTSVNGLTEDPVHVKSTRYSIVRSRPPNQRDPRARPIPMSRIANRTAHRVCRLSSSPIIARHRAACDCRRGPSPRLYLGVDPPARPRASVRRAREANRAAGGMRSRPSARERKGESPIARSRDRVDRGRARSTRWPPLSRQSLPNSPSSRPLVQLLALSRTSLLRTLGRSRGSSARIDIPPPRLIPAIRGEDRLVPRTREKERRKFGRRYLPLSP